MVSDIVPGIAPLGVGNGLDGRYSSELLFTALLLAGTSFPQTEGCLRLPMDDDVRPDLMIIDISCRVRTAFSLFVSSRLRWLLPTTSAVVAFGVLQTKGQGVETSAFSFGTTIAALEGAASGATSLRSTKDILLGRSDSGTEPRCEGSSLAAVPGLIAQQDPIPMVAVSPPAEVADADTTVAGVTAFRLLERNWFR
jgi:hypothetical protein